MKETRNSTVLASFVAYCKANPELRFWQALRNWVGYNFIWVSDFPTDAPDLRDTFSWEGRHGRDL